MPEVKYCKECAHAPHPDNKCLDCDCGYWLGEHDFIEWMHLRAAWAYFKEKTRRAKHVPR